MEQKLIRDLPNKYSSNMDLTDQIIIEDEDGTKLTTIHDLKNYLSTAINIDTVLDMKNTIFKEGDICVTSGYRSVNDGGSAVYRIVYKPTALDDGLFIHYLNTSDTLRAELVISDSINVHQAGAYGDGIHDDSNYIQLAINSGYKVTFDKSRIYRLNKPIYIKYHTVDFNNSTLLPIECSALVYDEQPDNSKFEIYESKVNNVNINCTNSGHNSPILITGNLSTISEIVLNNFNIYSDIIIDKSLKIISINASTAETIKISNGKIKLNNESDGSSVIYINTSNSIGKIVIDNIDIVDTSSSGKLIGLRAESPTYNDGSTLVKKNTKHNYGIDNTIYLLNSVFHGVGNPIYIGRNHLFIDKCIFEGIYEGDYPWGANSLFTFMKITEGYNNISISDSSIMDFNYIFETCDPSTKVTLNGINKIHNRRVNYNGQSYTAVRTQLFTSYIIAQMELTINGDLQLGPSVYDSLNNYLMHSSNKLIVNDYKDPLIYDIVTVSNSGSSFSINQITNLFINYENTENLKTIGDAGFIGAVNQKIAIVSGTSKYIEGSEIIKLKNNQSQIQLDPYIPIVLKFDGAHWIQIS